MPRVFRPVRCPSWPYIGFLLRSAARPFGADRCVSHWSARRDTAGIVQPDSQIRGSAPESPAAQTLGAAPLV